MSRFLESRDEGSFRQLYRLHSPVLHRVVVRTVGRPEVAEDLLQETWIRAVRGLESFRWRSSLRTWLTGIAVRCCREELRRAGPSLVDDPEPPGIGAPGPGALRIDLERAVATLPPGRREVVVLHDIEGFTHAEIAAALGIDEGTSKSQLSRARHSLRRRLAPSTAQPPPVEPAHE